MVLRHLMVSGATAISIVAYSASGLADCYVDSVGGNDANSGQAEDQAVKSQSKIPSGCTVIRYKRGSTFNEAVAVSGTNKTYTNYGNSSDPLPRFVVPHTANSGSLLSSFQGGVTVDGLYLSGSKGDGTMAGLIKGVCVTLGSNSKLLNSEISNCDIGIMLQGTGSLVQGNYIHDLTMAVDAASGVDPNVVGGAEGIFINGSNNEVAYNAFINCSSTAAWTGGSCDGGATEVTVGAGATLSGVKVHHNFSYNSCGFFEVSSGVQNNVGGTFADSEFFDNVSIDSGWLMLLQVNNTTLSNIKWENNTIVQHKGSANAGMLVTVFTGTSSGVSGGALNKGTVFLTNNFIILDGFTQQDYVMGLDANLEQLNNRIVKSPAENPGVVNVAGTAPADFDLVSGSPAIDQGASTDHTLDYLNRVVPDPSGKTDIGAFEYNATPSTSAGGAMGLGGAATAPVGGQAAQNAGTAGSKADSSGCSCRLVRSRTRLPVTLAILGTALLLRRRRHSPGNRRQ